MWMSVPPRAATTRSSDTSRVSHAGIYVYDRDKHQPSSSPLMPIYRSNCCQTRDQSCAVRFPSAVSVIFHLTSMLSCLIVITDFWVSIEQHVIRSTYQIRRHLPGPCWFDAQSVIHSRANTLRLVYSPPSTQNTTPGICKAF
jgi:hypothetical protein